jgi:hydroxymethylpyrimidine/phosphomethylpyrimidine kinase
VVTAITAQDTQGVKAVWGSPPEAVRAQMEAVCDDLRPAALKSGMLFSREIVEVVAERLRSLGIGNYVLDPVMAAKDGTRLLSAEGVDALRRELVPLAKVVTPNLAEASALVGERVSRLEEARAAAAKLAEMGSEWVLVKGGHLAGEPVDVLWHEGKLEELAGARLPGGRVHGTGCALSAAIAAGLAKGQGPREAVLEAREFLRGLLSSSVAIGEGGRVMNPGLGGERG